ncbi:hypothetical protein BaRGS_00018530 [Batillaria attramentaria]|uniref:Uncharacterized protein n=1 Tax=Batillaria attramentaria TaxID=370345 RepID=A0ABD0KSC0_9CAEN|nr:hypothetical protein BaRGS_010406 [Batillaria attramentaria]
MGCTESKVEGIEEREQNNPPLPSALNGKPPAGRHALTQVTKEYWDSVRNDVQTLIRDLSETHSDELTEGQKEYFELLKRWMRKYKDLYPAKQRVPGGDPNQHSPQPKPEDRNNLRPWLKTWEPFDTDVTKGQSAWEVLPDDVIKNDVTTPEQEKVLAARANRKHLHSVERMLKRREQLVVYFVKKYRMPKKHVLPYLQWADLLQRNKSELDRLSKG